MINKYTGLPKRHPFLYILTLVIIPVASLALVEYAQAKPSPFHDSPYGVAPRLLANCESKWVWSPYNITLEPVCRHVWWQLTREAILDYPIQ